MAKFAIIMPSMGGIIPVETIIEADELFTDNSVHWLRKSNGECKVETIALIPHSALVYKVAEPEIKDHSIKFPYIDQLEREAIRVRKAEIEELKQALTAQDEIISTKNATIKRLNTEIEDLLKGINGRDLTIAEKSERVGVLENANDHLRALINDLNDRVEKARLDENKTNYNQMRVDELNVELQGSDLLIKKLRRENELLSAQVKDERLKTENIAKAIKDSLQNPLVG